MMEAQIVGGLGHQGIEYGIAGEAENSVASVISRADRGSLSRGRLQGNRLRRGCVAVYRWFGRRSTAACASGCGCGSWFAPQAASRAAKRASRPAEPTDLNDADDDA
jgi:hypothetical protein